MRLSITLFSALTLAAGGLPGPGIPFGLFGMSARQMVDPYTSAMQHAHPNSILQDLAAARARGARIVINFAGSARNSTDQDGHFDLERWSARIDRFRPIADQLNAYVADGTLLATMLIDEPDAKKRWGGQTVPMTTIDRMAEYSKTIFPDLPTAVRAAPSDLRGYRWRFLDLSWAQYTSRKGPIAAYVWAEVAAARATGLGLIVGLNISKGGDGSSGIGGGAKDEPTMSGAEILRYGHALLEAPSACAFISWDDRPSVINRPDVAAALKELALAARAHPATPCRRAVTQGASGAPRSGRATMIPVDRRMAATYSGSVERVTSTTPPERGAWSTRRIPPASRYA